MKKLPALQKLFDNNDAHFLYDLVINFSDEKIILFKDCISLDEFTYKNELYKPEFYSEYTEDRRSYFSGFAILVNSDLNCDELEKFLNKTINRFESLDSFK